MAIFIDLNVLLEKIKPTLFTEKERINIIDETLVLVLKNTAYYMEIQDKTEVIRF